MLAASLVATESLTSARGDYEVSISMETGDAQVPAQEQTFLGGPITVAGTFAFSSEPQMADMSLGLTLGDETMDVGVRMLGDEAWLQVSGIWYAAPVEMTEMLAGPGSQQADMAQMIKTFAGAGIDPLTWMKDLSVVGEETLDGAATYHLVGTPDLSTMMVDMMALMQDEEALSALDPTGTMDGLMDGQTALIPGDEELQMLQEQIAAVFQEISADLWLMTDTMMPARLAAQASMAPPADEETLGPEAVNIAVGLSLRDHNRGVTVEAPTDAQPWTELERMLEEDPAALLGPLSGLLGMTGTALGTY